MSIYFIRLRLSVRTSTRPRTFLNFSQIILIERPLTKAFKAPTTNQNKVTKFFLLMGDTEHKCFWTKRNLIVFTLKMLCRSGPWLAKTKKSKQCILLNWPIRAVLNFCRIMFSLLLLLLLLLQGML